MTPDYKVICDNCNRDLTYTTNSVDYRILLESERMRCHEGAVTDMLIQPQIDKPMHFCGQVCLVNWIDDNWNKRREIK